MAKVLFYRCLRYQYEALASVNPDALYFLEDSSQLYLGEREISDCLIFVESWDLPNLPIAGKFYLNTVTGELKCCDAHGLRTIVPPITSDPDAFDDPTKVTYLASIHAIREWVLTQIQQSTAGVTDVTFAPETGDLTIVKNGEEVAVPLTGIAHSPTYENLVIRIPVYGSEDIVVNIPKDTFVRSGRYEPDYPLPDPPGGHGPAVVLVVSDGETTTEIVIPAAALVQIYTGGTTDTLSVTVNEETGVITGTVKISDIATNIIQSDENGLYVNGSNFAVKNTALQHGEVVLSDGEGNFIRSEVYVSESELSAGTIPTGDVVAQAIAQAISIATDELEARISALEERLPSINDEEIVIGRDNKYVSSGVKIGGPVLQYPATDEVVATEMAVKAAISEAKMSWDEINPYPGYRRITLQNATQTAGGDPTVASMYPPENVLTDSMDEIFYPATLYQTDTLRTEFYNGAGTPFIIAITFVIGPSGIGAIDPDARIMAELNRSGYTQGLDYNITQGEIYTNCQLHGGTWILQLTSTLRWNAMGLDLQLKNASGRWGGLGVAKIEYYLKET